MNEELLESISSDAAAIIDAAQRASEPKTLETDDVGLVTVALPPGVTIETVDNERYLDAPRRRTGVVTIGTVDALIGYVKRQRNYGTTLWVHPTKGQIRAVLDDHEPTIIDEGLTDQPAIRAGLPGHGLHRATLDLLVTPEWAHWTSLDNVLVDQIQFAEHVEDGLLEINTPDPTELLEIAQTFHAKTDIQFRSANRITDGQVQVLYDEDTTATAGQSGKMEIPQTFELFVSPFIGEPPYALTARLRYRVASGKLKIGYKLDRPDVVVRHALTAIATKLTEAFPGVVFIGSPR